MRNDPALAFASSSSKTMQSRGMLPGTRPCIRLLCLVSVVGSFTVLILAMIYGANSDADNLSGFVKQMLPAGHCLCDSSSVFHCADCLSCNNVVNVWNQSAVVELWKFDYKRDGKNEGLTTNQCEASFPGLFEELHNMGKERKNSHVTIREMEELKLYGGMARGMIFDGELYVIENFAKSEDHRTKTIAIFHSINRAISACSNRQSLPSIEFVFSVEDMAEEPTKSQWVLAKRAKDINLWLMPDFGFWSWNIKDVGPYNEVVDDIIEQEKIRPWEKKEKKLVWRGKLSFAPKLRRALLDQARGKAWNDVKEIRWDKPESMAEDFLSAVDQCNYMFTAHVEGRSYSGSLKYRQACQSVVVAHKMQWFQHHHYLMVPDGPHQNYVEVERDFKDLPEKIEYLLANPDVAKRIANNNIKTFRERYLTPAAEACYWRAMIHKWAEVSETPKLVVSVSDGIGNRAEVRKRKGMRFENWALLDSTQHKKFKYES